MHKRAHKHIWLWQILLGVASSCAPIPNQSIPAAYYPDQPLKKIDEEASASSIFTPVDWIDENWWQMFNDPQLTAFIEEALSDNPHIKMADASAWIAKAEVKIKAATLYPHLDIDVESFRVHVSKTGIFENAPPTLFPFNYTQTGLMFNFSYELDWWGKNRHAIAAAVGDAQLACAESVAARLAIALSVAEAYFQYQTSLKLANNAELQKQNQQRQLELTQQRIDNRIDSDITLQKHERRLLQADEHLLGINQNTKLFKHRVLALLSSDFQEIIDPRIVESVTAPFPLPANMPLNLLSHRPDIMGQLWKVYAESRRVGEATALFYPDINLRALLGWQTIHIAKLFDAKSKAALWGAALHLPLFHAGELEANLEAQRYAYVEAVAEYESLILHAIRETLDAITTLESLNARATAAQAIADSAATSYELTNDRFQHNLASQFDLLTAESEWLLADEHQIKLQGLIELALLALIKSLGGGFSP